MMEWSYYITYTQHLPPLFLEFNSCLSKKKLCTNGIMGKTFHLTGFFRQRWKGRKSLTPSLPEPPPFPFLLSLRASSLVLSFFFAVFISLFQNENYLWYSWCNMTKSTKYLEQKQKFLSYDFFFFFFFLFYLAFFSTLINLLTKTTKRDKEEKWTLKKKKELKINEHLLVFFIVQKQILNGQTIASFSIFIQLFLFLRFLVINFFFVFFTVLLLFIAVVAVI